MEERSFDSLCRRVQKGQWNRGLKEVREDARDQEAQRVHCFALQSNSSRFILLLTLFQVCPPGALAFPQQHFDLDTIVAMTKMSQRQFVRVARQTPRQDSRL